MMIDQRFERAYQADSLREKRFEKQQATTEITRIIKEADIHNVRMLLSYARGLPKSNNSIKD